MPQSNTTVAALTQRGDRPSSPKHAVDRAFLPAAIEVLETPANPLGRTVALVLAAFFVIAVGWAAFAEIEVVAVARGQVEPSGGVQAVEPLERGVVRRLTVSNGDRVEAGQLLIELDPTEFEVDVEQLTRERQVHLLEVARLLAMLEGLAGRPTDFSPPPEADAEEVAIQRQRLDSDLAAYRAQMAELRAETGRRVAERAAAAAEIVKGREILPLIAEREQALHQLMEQGNTPRPVWLEVKTAAIQTRQEIAINEARLVEAESAIFAAERQQERLAADAVRDAMAQLIEARDEVAARTVALRKARQRDAYTRLAAPVAGWVQELEKTVPGRVVNPAEPLLVIVPADAPLLVEAKVPNADVGFLRVGDPVEIKIDSFPFTRFGTLQGQLVKLSSSSIEDEELGLVYEARIAIDDEQDERTSRIELTPGMQATAEIKTGTRTVLEFLFSPIARTADEALRER